MEVVLIGVGIIGLILFLGGTYFSVDSRPGGQPSPSQPIGNGSDRWAPAWRDLGIALVAGALIGFVVYRATNDAENSRSKQSTDEAKALQQDLVTQTRAFEAAIAAAAKKEADARSADEQRQADRRAAREIRDANARVLRSLSGPGRAERAFNGMDLRGARLDGLQLQDADLNGAKLEDASMYVIDLVGADLQDANFTCANLLKAKLGDENPDDKLGQTLLRRADFRGAVLRNAVFGRADLVGALFGSPIQSSSGASYTEAPPTDLRGADLRFVENLTPGMVNDSWWDLPSGPTDVNPDGTKGTQWPLSWGKGVTPATNPHPTHTDNDRPACSPRNFTIDPTI